MITYFHLIILLLDILLVNQYRLSCPCPLYYIQSFAVIYVFQICMYFMFIIRSIYKLKARRMGNETSQFQSQFYNLYNFVAVIEDPYFKQVKIYRKVKFSFNYMMIVESPVLQLKSPSQTVQISDYIKEQLGVIRRYQSEVTSKLQYYHMLEGIINIIKTERSIAAHHSLKSKPQTTTSIP